MFSFVNWRDQTTRVGLSLSLSLFLAAGVAGMVQDSLRALTRTHQEEIVLPPVDPDLARKEAIADYLAERNAVDPAAVRSYVDLAWEESSKHPDLTPELLLAVIQKESEFRHGARSFYGAEGLMQVVPRFHREKMEAKESLYDAKVNIRVGAQVLQEYITQKNGDLVRALRKYSANATNYAEVVQREANRLKDI